MVARRVAGFAINGEFGLGFLRCSPVSNLEDFDSNDLVANVASFHLVLSFYILPVWVDRDIYHPMEGISEVDWSLKMGNGGERAPVKSGNGPIRLTSVVRSNMVLRIRESVQCEGIDTSYRGFDGLSDAIPDS